MIDQKFYNKDKVLNELYFKTFTKDGICWNPNFNPTKPTYEFNDEEIIQLRDETLLYESVGYCEQSITYVVELLDYYNFFSTKQLYDLIEPNEVKNVT